MSSIFSNEVEADVTGTVSVSGNVTVVQPTGSNLHTVNDNAGGASAVNIQDGGNSITVDGNTNPNGLTDTQLRATPVPISGTVTTGGLTDTQLRASPVPVSFATTAGVPTVTRVAVSTTVATLATADSTRKRLLIFNEAGTLYVKLGATATDTDYTMRLTANTFAEIDFSQTAVVTAIKAAGNSNVQVTSIA